MLGKCVCFVARFLILLFYIYIYRPIYRHIGFLNHKIFVSVSALKILYRSGSSSFIRFFVPIRRVLLLASVLRCPVLFKIKVILFDNVDKDITVL